MCQQYTTVRHKFVQTVLDDGWVGCLSPGACDARDLQSLPFGDLGEAIAKVANSDRHHMLTW